jgi:beta-glucanase (GH16 family)
MGVAMVLVSLGCSSASTTTTDQPTATTAPWKQVWSDSFNGPANSGVNGSTWKYDVGQGIFGTNEVETMTAATNNVHLDGNGNLDIVAVNQNSAWTSGRIQTNQLFEAPAGGEMMITASIKQPDPANGRGYWPGFWMLGSGHWPTDGEVDILEDVNGLNKEAGTLHCGNLTQRNSDGTFGPCHEGTGVGSGLQDCANCQQGFQTYTVIIDRRNESNQQIRWYLNGHQFFSVSESAVGASVWEPAVDNSFTILLDVAIGGSYPNTQCQCGTPTSQTSSLGTMVIRNVNVSTN